MFPVLLIRRTLTGILFISLPSFIVYERTGETSAEQQTSFLIGWAVLFIIWVVLDASHRLFTWKKRQGFARQIATHLREAYHASDHLVLSERIRALVDLIDCGMIPKQDFEKIIFVFFGADQNLNHLTPLLQNEIDRRLYEEDWQLETASACRAYLIRRFSRPDTNLSKTLPADSNQISSSQP